VKSRRAVSKTSRKPAKLTSRFSRKSKSKSAALKSSSSMVGTASYYRHGKVTANGEPFKPMGLTAAHRTLPFGTRVKVTHMGTGRSVVVRINDRGPFIRGRIIDLAMGAARRIGVNGLAKVSLQVVN
jgi:rare lipoprotein A